VIFRVKLEREREGERVGENESSRFNLTSAPAFPATYARTHASKHSRTYDPLKFTAVVDRCLSRSSEKQSVASFGQ